MMGRELRTTGIDILGDVSWGTHFCQFYQTREDLLDILVPYFRAGLENNEFCMWITSAPVGEDEATKALRSAASDLDGYLRTGQIEILPHTEWYLKDGAFDAQRVLNGWVDKLNWALAAGFDGLRLTGNTHWVEEADWDSFADYEQRVNNVIGDYRMLAICSYALDRCGAAEILDVVRSHQFALIRRAGKWKIVESSNRKRTEETLQLAAQQWQTTFDGVADAVCLLDTQANVKQCNSAMAKLADRRPEECVGRNCCELVHGSPQHLEGCPLQRARSSLRRETKELAVADRWLQVTVDPLKDDEGKLIGAVHAVADITDRKRAEEKIADLAKFPAENPDPVLRVAGDGNIIFANKAAQPLLDAWSCRVGAVLPQKWTKLIGDVLVSGHREDVEIESDGRIFLITLAPVVEAGYVNLYGRDITGRKRTEESLGLSHVCLEVANRERDTASLLREFVMEVQAFTRCAAVGIRLLDESGNIPYEAYAGFEERFYESESPLSINSDKCMCINVIKGDTNPDLPFYSEGGSFYMNATTRFLATVSQKDKGQTRNACNEFGYESVALVPIASEGRIVGLIHVADPKENMVPLEAVKVLEKTALQLSTAIQRVAADEAVKRSHKELRALAARLQAAREEERIRLARKIHDDVGHNLAALKRELAWLGGKFPKAAGAPRTPKLAQRLESMSKLLAETIQTARETASDLRPGLLDDVGLAAAIEWEAKEFQRRTGVKCRFTDTAERTQFDDEQSTALFRICQELLTNIANHAGATAVTIALKKQADELILEVSDNGKGIEEEQISSARSLGILGMRERALVLGGAFAIWGKPGKGTTATVQIPLRAPARGRGK